MRAYFYSTSTTDAIDTGTAHYIFEGPVWDGSEMKWRDSSIEYHGLVGKCLHFYVHNVS